MTPRIVLLHATAAGSTTGIADRIREVLEQAGCTVRAERLTEGTAPDPAGLADADAVVLGSAVHDMAWLPPALAATHVLATLDPAPPLWCFSVGGVQPHGPLTRTMAAQEIRRVEQGFPPGLRPRAHRLFGGIVQFDTMPLWGKLFYRFVAGGRPGDHRDWPVIEAWAFTVAAEVRAGLPRPADPDEEDEEDTMTTTADPQRVPRPAAPGPETAALRRFHRDVTWTGTISAGGMGPDTPAMTARGSGTHHTIQDGRWIVGDYRQEQFLSDGTPVLTWQLHWVAGWDPAANAYRATVADCYGHAEVLTGHLDVAAAEVVDAVGGWMSADR
ncbi:flavodoxin domain-containing protein, partial [Pseudonocardia xishanensis]|uniref:flavodoxin domain-containing protein n=1 Tax=Pseudonocardia xishanensis TaxID=630995 RepID=UPI0031EACCD7